MEKAQIRVIDRSSADRRDHDQCSDGAHSVCVSFSVCLSWLAGLCILCFLLRLPCHWSEKAHWYVCTVVLSVYFVNNLEINMKSSQWNLINNINMNGDGVIELIDDCDNRSSLCLKLFILSQSVSHSLTIRGQQLHLVHNYFCVHLYSWLLFLSTLVNGVRVILQWVDRSE